MKVKVKDAKLFLVMMLLVMMSIAIISCGKEDTEETEESHNYAVNEVKDMTESEELETETDLWSQYTEESESETAETIVIADPLPMTFNTTVDANASYILDMNAISMDGHIIAFPCDFNYLRDIFGELYLVEYPSSNSVLTGDEEGTYIDATFNPTTGYGVVTFKFKSPNDTTCKLTDMICYGFEAFGGNNYNDPVMTIALPNNIMFGSSISEIRDYFGSVIENGSFNDKSGFNSIYKTDICTVSFRGFNDRLNMISVDYSQKK